MIQVFLSLFFFFFFCVPMHHVLLHHRCFSLRGPKKKNIRTRDTEILSRYMIMTDGSHQNLYQAFWLALTASSSCFFLSNASDSLRRFSNRLSW